MIHKSGTQDWVQFTIRYDITTCNVEKKVCTLVHRRNKPVLKQAFSQEQDKHLVLRVLKSFTVQYYSFSNFKFCIQI